MTTTKRTNLNSSAYERIAAIRMSPGERVAAIEALQDGDRIAEAILSIARVLRLLVTTPHLKPILKH